MSQHHTLIDTYTTVIFLNINFFSLYSNLPSSKRIFGYSNRAIFELYVVSIQIILVITNAMTLRIFDDPSASKTQDSIVLVIPDRVFENVKLVLQSLVLTLI